MGQGSWLEDAGGLAKARHLSLEVMHEKVTACLMMLATAHVRMGTWHDRVELPTLGRRGRPFWRVAIPHAAKHLLQQHGVGRLKCQKCAATASTVGATKRLRRAKCKGNRLASLPCRSVAGHLRVDDHVLMCSGSLFWCWKCGGWGYGMRLGKLSKHCQGGPANLFAGTVLRRLKAGLHPASKVPIGAFRPATSFVVGD